VLKKSLSTRTLLALVSVCVTVSGWSLLMIAELTLLKSLNLSDNSELTDELLIAVSQRCIHLR